MPRSFLAWAAAILIGIPIVAPLALSRLEASPAESAAPAQFFDATSPGDPEQRLFFLGDHDSGLVDTPLVFTETSYAEDAYAPSSAGVSAKALDRAERTNVFGSVALHSLYGSSPEENVGSGDPYGERGLDDPKLAPAVAGTEPAASKQSADVGLLLLIVTSQDSLAALALAPHPGVSTGLPYAASLASPLQDAVAGGVRLASTESLPIATPGWLLQAAWTVALAAFGLAALRAFDVPLAWRLFSRFEKEDVLNHDRRAQLFECIRGEPGIPFGQLSERVGLAPGVAQHHLRLLEQHELVRRLRDGRTTRFYPKGLKITPPAALAPTRQRILRVLQTEPGLTAVELAQRMGQRVQSTWDHLNRLRDAGLLAGERRGRAFAWRTTTP